MKRPATVALSTDIALQFNLHELQKEITVTFQCEAVSFLLKTHAPDDFIAETSADKMRYTHPLNKWPTEYAETPWNNVLRCDRVYKNYTHKEIFIERLLESIVHRMQSY